jgi:hypothetical protein
MKNSFLAMIFMLLVLPQLGKGEAQDPAVLLRAVESMNGLEKNVNASTTIKADCTTCNAIGPDRKLELSGSKLDLDALFIYKNNVPYVIHLKRTKNTPPTVTIRIKNGHSECAKMYYGTNPFNGSFVIECMARRTVYLEQALDLNLKKLPSPVDDEEQIIEIKITKSNVEDENYKLEAEFIKGPVSEASIDKKFWSSGYNISFTPKDAGKL